jgi:hypothetical protein
MLGVLSCRLPHATEAPLDWSESPPQIRLPPWHFYIVHVHASGYDGGTGGVSGGEGP